MRDAPPAETIHRLAALRKAGRPITTAVVPEADHGIYEFEGTGQAQRSSRITHSHGAAIPGYGASAGRDLMTQAGCRSGSIKAATYLAAHQSP